jgi:hypothetical protein
MAFTRGFLAAFLILSTSCAGSSAPEGSVPKPVVDRNVIRNEELQDPVLRGMDALRAIQYLRPAFFKGSGPQSFANTNSGLTQFSMDYGPVQPLSQLSALPSLSLQMAYEIRFLDVNEAQNRFGLNANSGPVIVVVSNKQ